MIRKQLKSKDGFTLIELLGTIVIIGIMGTIAVASVINIKNKQNERFDESQVELIKQAGQTYFTDNKRLLPVIEGQTNIVSLKELIDKNYINKVYDSKKQEFNTGNDQNGTPNSYVWVQKQESGEYKYEAYCLVNNKHLGTNIPASKTNDGTITFTYNGFHDSGNKHYTNGKTENYVQVTINMQKVENYKYEILKDDKQNKVSEVTKAGSGLIKITLKAKDYPEGEYKIKVTTYNDRGTPKSATSQPIYMDKEAPTCDILSDYKPDSNSEDGIWYSSNSVNQNKQKLGTNNKLPIKVSPRDNGSGAKKVTMYSDPGLTTSLVTATGGKTATYEAGNGKRITYYAEVEDNVGNKKTCSKSFTIDTEPPTCDSSGIDGKKGNLVDGIQWYIDKGVTPYAYFTDKVSGVGSDIVYGEKITKTNSIAQAGIVTIKDKANNEGICNAGNIYFDNKAPDCQSIGGSTIWVNSKSPNKSTTLTGICNDNNGSGCAAKSSNLPANTTYDNDGNVLWKIDWEGEWSNLSPGTVYDKAGNKTICPKNQIVKHDWTLPDCKINLNGKKTTPNNNWYISDVEASLEVGENMSSNNYLSGINTELSKLSEKKKTTNGANQKFTGQAVDNAGNVGTCEATVNIDKEKPTISVEMKIGSKNDFSWEEGSDYTSDTWKSGYVNTKATATRPTSKLSGLYPITYTTTGKTASTKNEVVGAQRRINAEGTSTITYKVCTGAGLCATSKKTIKLDRTAPKIYSCYIYNTNTNFSFGFACNNGNSLKHTNHGVAPYVADEDGGSGLKTDNKITFKVGSISETRNIEDNRHFCISTGSTITDGNTQISVSDLKDNAGNTNTGKIICSGTKIKDEKYSGAADWRDSHKCTSKNSNVYTCLQPTGAKEAGSCKTGGSSPTCKNVTVKN